MLSNRQRMRSPGWYSSPGTCSLLGRRASALPRSSRYRPVAAAHGARHDVADHVLKVVVNTSFSNCRIRCITAGRAVCAAIRPSVEGSISFSTISAEQHAGLQRLRFLYVNLCLGLLTESTTLRKAHALSVPFLD